MIGAYIPIKKKNLCYIITQPIKSEGKYKIRGKINLLVGRQTKNKKENFIALDFGYPFREGTTAEIIIDDKFVFKLNTFDETAWTKYSEVEKLSEKIIKAMIKGNSLLAVGVSNRGTLTKDFYSLKGFSKAFRKLKKVCANDYK